jgi:hypothetical protein
MKLSRQTIPSAVALMLMLWAPTAALAIPINGTFNIAGGSNATVMATSLLFACTVGSLANAPCPAPGGSPPFGNFLTSSGTDSFAGFATQGGYIENLSQGTTPLNQNFLLPNWIFFSSSPGNPIAVPDIRLDLRFIFLGVDPMALPGVGVCGGVPAPGQTCTPIIPALVSGANPGGVSPYNLQNVAGGGSTASFALSGTAVRISTGEVSNFNGTFTAQFSDPFQTVLGQLTTTGAVSNSFSATFVVSAIPEPATESLAIGAVLILAGLGLRKKFTSRVRA